MDADALRKFYFSHGSDFKSFKTAQDARGKKDAAAAAVPGSNLSDVYRAGPGPMVESRSQPPLSTSAVSVSTSSAAHPTVSSASSTTVVAPIATVGISSLKTLSEASGGKKRTKASLSGMTTSMSGASAAPVAASPEYLQFLKRQQDLVYRHNALSETYGNMNTSRVDHQRALLSMRREAMELLRTVEMSTDWNLRSKYDVQQLIRDCTLALQPVELVDDAPAVTDGMSFLFNEMAKLRDTHANTEQVKAHALFLDQALRRGDALVKALGEGNMDATELSRIPNTLVVQLQRTMELPTVDALVEPFETTVSRQAFKVSDARVQRDAAIEEGEVHVAEKLCYEIIDAHEAMLHEVIAKHAVLDQAIQDNDAVDALRVKYAAAAVDELERVRVRAEKLRARCEEDVKKMFALREKVEEVEAQTSKKVQADREASDLVLEENHRKLELVFAKINELEKEVEILERERHREFQKRVVEKDKDEHRRAEFTQFCGVVEAHLQPLERSIRNMDLIAHSVDLVKDVVGGGFESVKLDLAERATLLKDIRLESQKQHVEVFRGLLLELGDIVHRKERMIEETEKSVQQAQIQQEILAETFNPNAKKFGDVKKRLLSSRDELEQDVTELKSRAEVALSAFAVTEQALRQAGVTFVHPVTQQQHRILEQQARLMQARAAAVGFVEGQPTMREIEELRSELQQTRLTIDESNVDTSGTINKALPLIKAASKARHR